MSRVSKHIEVSSVSLVDLKAEISRRQIEIKQKAEKLSSGCTVIKNTSSNSTEEKRSIWRKPPKNQRPNPGIEATQTDSEDVQQLENCRRKLEAKAKLYEALRAAAASGNMSYSKSRIHPEEDDAPLVDFELKAQEESRQVPRSDSEDSCASDDEGHYPPAASDEEWEEYTDDLGVKRVCMRKDHPNRSATEPPPRPDGPLTYAHLREGEIREHGVGFYAFSEDKEKREAEMARLKELHRATEEGRARAEAIRAKRDARMGQRLARLRARKGLPDVATAAAQCLAQTSAPPTPLPVSADAQSDIRLGSEDLDVASMLRRLRDEAELRASLNNPTAPEQAPVPFNDRPTNLADVFASQNSTSDSHKSREWDRGKSMMPAQRYIHEERVKRLPEFAPPSFY